MEFASKQLIFLTGAGFSKNFGGFLSAEMWSRIFNYPGVAEDEKLAALLKKNFDFESVYSNIMNSAGAPQKELLQKAVLNAYDRLNQNIVATTATDPGFPMYEFYKLLDLFRGTRELKGLFFTLNQDLLVERWDRNYKPIGAPFFPDMFYSNGMLGRDEFRTLPTDLASAQTEFANWTQILYIKLHGSYGWKSSDGSEQLVIGKNKSDLIQKEPLLNFYFDIFKQALNQGDKKLVVMGYGFGDDHINGVICDAAKRSGLRLYIINPSGPEAFKKYLSESIPNMFPDIWNSVRGYFPYRCNELFVHNQNDTVAFQEVRAALQS